MPFGRSRPVAELYCTAAVLPGDEGTARTVQRRCSPGTRGRPGGQGPGSRGRAGREPCDVALNNAVIAGYDGSY